MFVPMNNLRGWPEGHDAALYYNRKGFKSLNTLIFAGFDRRIYDIVPNAPGSFHDNTVYNLSTMKPYLESRVPRIQVLGNNYWYINILALYTVNKWLRPYRFLLELKMFLFYFEYLCNLRNNLSNKGES